MHPIADCTPLQPLFADHRRGRGLLDAALHSGQGRARCDAPAAPSLAHLQVGGFALFGGDPDYPGISTLMATLPPTWIIPESAAWEKALLVPLEPQVKRRRRTRFAPPGLIDHPPTPRGYRIIPVQPAHIQPRIQPDGRLFAFPSAAAFAASGLGFCALAGDQIAAYALSYAVAPTSIEIEVQTGLAHRRRGLAFALCSRLLALCFERGLVPHWDAANPISANLAKKLGYQQVEEYLSFRPLRPDEL
ncbi:MAG: GNAT family N-acetyltransferase [Candidatus Latescibacteria bacterium]|nr:GNAT family N-acetyltransferase [Candidatus Latescibacterota bacterium]